MRSRALAVMAISMCAACSSGAMVPAGPQGGALPAAAGAAAEASWGVEPRATATPGPTFSIALPTQLQGTVKSATVTIAPLAGPPSTPRLTCHAALCGRGTARILLKCTTALCSGTVAPPAGTDVFVATLYPAANGTGTSLAAGTLVSTVGAGPVLPIDVSFGAAFAKLTLSFSKTTIVGGSTTQLTVLPEALDAAGNTIIGPYAATGITLADSDKSGATRLSATALTASPASPLVFSYNGALIANPTLSARASNVKTVSSLVTITVTARELSSALNAVETYYLTRPHKSLASDLASTVADLAKSAAFSSATATEGGIDATFANGVKGLIFADRVEPKFVHPLPGDGFLSAPNGHEIAFLANESGDETFYPKRQHDFAAAFVRDGFTKLNGYGVDALNVSLENIVALGSAHALDFLDVSTHGALDAAGGYHWQSTTPLTDSGLATYAKDMANGTVTPSLALSNAYLDYLPSFAFTANFLAEHLTFNKGAILDNQSCCGENANITAGPQQLSKVGLGRYYGWTARVAPNDADESDAFLFDRLLGERSPSVTGLNLYASQRTPAQRPFPLDAVFGVMQTENRNSPIQTPPGYAYAYSPPLGDAAGSSFVAADFGGETGIGAPIEYALPSIERLQVTESTSTLEIVGRFPATKGSVSIAGSVGPNASTWNSEFILLPVATSGAGSWGIVTVQSAGIASNPVPLTQWAGALSLSGSGNLSVAGHTHGKGSWSGASAYATLFRSDVHPTVVAIDSPPQAQNFYFSNLETGTTGTFTAFGASYQQIFPCTSGGPTVCGGYSEALLSSPAAMHSLTGTSYFTLAPVATRAATCNNGLAGPQPGTTNAFCTSFGSVDTNAATCTRAKTYPGGFAFCGPTGKSLVSPGGYGSPLRLVMNPVSYAVSLSPNPTSTGVGIRGILNCCGASLSAQFQSPLGAPPASPSGGV